MRPIVPRVAAVHDLSGFGRVSLTIIIPILSTMGVQVCPLPTAVLSTHTGGFDNYKLIDFTDYLEEYIKHWSRLNIEFDCIYTGFLGSPRQIDIISGFISDFNKENQTVIEPALNKGVGNILCVSCGQCIVNCPVGAICEKNDTEKVWNAIKDPQMHVIAQTAPAVRATLGEEFDMEMGTNVKGKMVAALRHMGFDKVFDTNFGAGLAIMEEGNELINRIKNNGKLPLITSCSPGWVKYCEYFYPEFLDNLSSCKSLHEMMGAVMKSYYAEKNDVDPSKIFIVSVMPCTAKKFEAVRPELNASCYPDVDAVVTTRELAMMIRESGIDFKALPDEQFDPVFGDSTGAAIIFGATGGVMKAVLRTASEILSGKPLDNVEITDVRGFEGVREAEISVRNMKIKAAVAHGLGNVRKLLDMVKTGEKQYHFIEIMACPGGCINGGGQPNSYKAHRLLHTHYIPREK